MAGSPTAPEWRTLCDVLQGRSAHAPDKDAYIFLSDRGSETERLTYRKLDLRARAIAAAIQRIAAPGKPVILVYPQGLDFITAFFACLYAGVIAVPVYPPRRNQTTDRLDRLGADTGATLALTADSAYDDVLARRFQVLATARIPDDCAASWQDPGVNPETVAFLQYTSGSTMWPRGVILTHANLLHNQRMIESAFGHSAATIVAGWLPLYHDMGLIGNVIQPLFVGGSCILMPPAAFLLRPFLWLEVISRYRATTSGAPNFAYDLCVRKITGEQRQRLDLSSWDLAYNGSEPVRAATMERFSAAFAACGFRREAFYPCFGLAEATLFLTGGCKGEVAKTDVIQGAGSSDTRIVSCGHTRLGQSVTIADPETATPVPPGVTGEIWAAGPSVAQGYWNQPEKTAATFQAYLAGGDGPFLRTGDLGCIRDGELYVLGRIKDLIIIRGRNYYPQDIERTVEEVHPDLKSACGSAFSVDVNDDVKLVVAHELVRNYSSIDLSSLVGDIRQAVAQQHELSVYSVLLLKPGTIPRTSSGKVQRMRCRDAFLSGSFYTIVNDNDSYLRQ